MSSDPTVSEYELLAGEYVLGLIDGEELLRARALAEHDAGFAEQVAYWEGRFADLLAEMPAMMAPDAVWQRIDEVVSRPPHAALLAHETAPSADVLFLRSKVARWRMITAVTAAAAAALAVVVVTGPMMQAGSQATSQPGLQAAQDGAQDLPSAAPLLAANVPIGDTALRLALTYVPEREQLTVSAAGLTADGVHDHELWLVDGDGGLHSLGVVTPGQDMRHAVAAELAPHFHNGTRLVLTREPIGGSLAGTDAGPVVAEGHFSEL